MGQLTNLSLETGDLSQFDSVSDPNSRLTVTNAAALSQVGAFGMNAESGTNFNSHQAIKGISLGTPATTPVWRFRFYVDTNGLAGWAALEGTAPLQFRLAGAADIQIKIEGPAAGVSPDYLIVVQAVQDSGATSQSTKIILPDGVKIIEGRVQAATGAATNDGRVDVWINGIPDQTAAALTIFGWQRFTRAWPDDVRMGLGGSSPSGGGQSIFIDECIVRDDDVAIGINPDTSLGQVADLNHETGDLSQYTVLLDVNNQLSASLPAALAGTMWGMRAGFDANTDGAAALLVIEELLYRPWSVPVWRIRFYFDPNSLPGQFNSDNIRLIDHRELGNQDVEFVVKGTNVGSPPYDYTVRIRDDAGVNQSITSGNSGALSDQPHIIEMRIQAATDDKSADGRVDTWIDADPDTDPPTISLTGVQRFARIWPTQLRIGRGTGLPIADGNSWLIDEIVVRQDDQTIGPVPAPPLPGVEIMAKRVIALLGGKPVITEDGEATEAITPGYLLEGVSAVSKQTGTGRQPARVALERDELGRGIDVEYANGETVKVGAFHPGQRFLGFCASGENIAEGELVEAAAGGTVAGGALIADALGFAHEAVDNTAGPGDARIDVEAI